MRFLQLAPLLLALPGCGLYTMENDCGPEPDEAFEVDGSLIAVESVTSAMKIAPMEGAHVVESEGGVRREVFSPAERFETSTDELALQVGMAVLRLRAPAGAGAYRLEDLGARSCEAPYFGGSCISPRGTVDVTDFAPDSIDLLIHVDDAPLDDGPALRGSVRLLFKRWQHEVCRARREGSQSAFAVRY